MVEKYIKSEILKWLKRHKDSGTLADPSNFVFTPQAMTTNGTSGIFKAFRKKWYFYVSSDLKTIEMEL